MQRKHTDYNRIVNGSDAKKAAIYSLVLVTTELIANMTQSEKISFVRIWELNRMTMLSVLLANILKTCTVHLEWLNRAIIGHFCHSLLDIIECIISMLMVC